MTATSDDRQPKHRPLLLRITHRSATTIAWLFKRTLYLLAILFTGWLIYDLVVDRILAGQDRPIAFLLLWLVTAYLVLPRAQRFLTRIYVPDYFVGRVRTSDGLLGDPVNLALLGDERELVSSMESAGWTRADDLTLRSGMRIVRATLLRRRYPSAPVSSLFLFSRRQDLAFEQEVPDHPSRRHHVRFWKCPPGWYLPGGLKVDWVGAGTYDRSVGFSLYTLQITHKIDDDTDEERDYILRTLIDAHAVHSVRWVENYFSGYHSRNGGGDAIRTDGNLPILRLQEALEPTRGSVGGTMSRTVYVNLPVKDLARTTAFFGALGLSFDDRFSDENTACMIISDEAYALLHLEPVFKDFTHQDITDTSSSREVIVGLSADSREDVDDLVAAVIASGGQSVGDPVDDGGTYMHAFRDPDGHQWSFVHRSP